jgi:hypothetical protein
MIRDPNRGCAVSGCVEKHFGRGYCKKHHKAWARWGDPLADHTLRKGICSVCGSPQQARGLCKKHYQRWSRLGTVELPTKSVVERMDEATLKGPGCWVWQGAVGGLLKHGQVWNGEKVVYAHRVAWEIANGCPVPDGLIVRHKCDNPPCVNPDHLLVGTMQDNTNDMISRGRASWQKRSAA